MQEVGYTDTNGAADEGAASWGYDQQGETVQPQGGGDDAAVTGQFIPTTGQTTGGGPMRQGRGGSRFNPMGGRRGPVGDGGPVSAASAEKNDMGYIIFAYNIGYQTQENQLYSLFAAYGVVAKVNVIQDFARGQGKGYGFVTMPNAEEAEAAVNGLNGVDFEGNSLQIRFKSPKGVGPPMKTAMRGRGRGGFVSRGGFGQRDGYGQRGGAPRGRGGMRGGRGGRGGGGYAQQDYTAYPGYEQQAYAGYDATAAGYAAGYGSDPYAAAAADPYAVGYAGQGYATYGAATGGWQ